MAKRWILRPADEAAVAALSEGLKLPRLSARILVQRGVTGLDAAQSFLRSSLQTDLPSPFLMADMERAVERLADAVARKELVCIWGDYDVDGTTGTACLVVFLRAIGCEPIYYVPHRIEEGYGLNAEGLKRLAARGVALVVTVDCGIANHAEVALARSLGLDVIIVDHHQPSPELPPARAILNPHRPDCPFPDKGLCAAGLAFYLTIGLRARLRDAGWFSAREVPDLRRFLDIISLGTIADLVPLTGVNRVLTRRGLLEMAASRRPGIVALKQVAGIPAGEMSAGRVGFQLGPRINAAGRMDFALKVVEMLTTDSPDVACRVAEELERNNRERQATEAEVLASALELLNDTRPPLEERYSIVLGAEGWHPGVLGIVASRLVERFYRPTVVIGFRGEEGKGSARSIRGFPLIEGLRRCDDLLERYGGHPYAGGLTIRREKLDLFGERFEEVVRSTLAPEDLQPVLEFDARLDFPELSIEVVRQLEPFEPFGIGNPEPTFTTRGVEVLERRDFKGGARFKMRQGGKTFDAVAFRLEPPANAQSGPPRRETGNGDLNSTLAPGAKLDVVYRVGLNDWGGTYAVELYIVDARPSERDA